MKIRIIPHGPEWYDAVNAFNGRMRAAGSRWGFYPESTCTWLPYDPSSSAWREYHLAVDDQDHVRGGFALKPQRWLVNGAEQVVTDWQGPFSEGDIDNRFAAMGLRMIRDMLKKQPLLFSWGHGGDGTAIVQMLRSMGWTLHQTPVCLHVVHPFAFLRQCRYTRTTPARTAAHDVAAFTGLGSVALRAAQTALRWRHRVARSGPATEVTTVEAFGPWADELWERNKYRYAALAVRDASAMNRLLPTDGRWPEAIRLRVTRGGTDIGWAAVRDTRLSGDARFGDLRLGSVIDCFAAPEDAPEVIRQATRFLRRRGVDLILSNQAHPGWVQAFAASGYVVLRDRRLFAMSPPLLQALSPWETTKEGLHLTNLDGHGPHVM